MSIELNKNKQWFLQELKESYIERTYKVYENRLPFLERFEQTIGKEIENFNETDIETFFLSIGKSSSSLYGFKTVLLQYYDFLLKNNIAKGINKFELITYDLLKKWSNKRREEYRYVSEVEAECIARIFAFNNRDKAVILLSFYGLSVDEISELKLSNLDIENNIININGKQFKVSEFTMETCVYSNEEIEYYSFNGKSQSFNQKPKKLEQSERIVKPTIYGKKNKHGGCGRTIIEGAIRLLRNIPSDEIHQKINMYYCYPLKYITLVSLNKSGLFNSLYQREIKNKIDVKEELKSLYTNYYMLYKEYLIYKENVVNRNVFVTEESALDQV